MVKVNQGIRTPEGATLLDGMCLCAVHCSNHCEASHCPPGTPWCRCWCHADRYLAMQEEISDEYDPATCQTAAELRAAGILIPTTIPDCAWIPKGSMVVVGEPKVTSKAPNLLTVQGLSVMFTVPFRWVEATITVGEGKGT